MMPHENISFQLVDLRAVSAEHPVPWLASTLQTADAALLVVDLADPACLEQVETVRSVLRERGVTLTDRWEPADLEGIGRGVRGGAGEPRMQRRLARVRRPEQRDLCGALGPNDQRRAAAGRAFLSSCNASRRSFGCVRNSAASTFMPGSAFSSASITTARTSNRATPS